MKLARREFLGVVAGAVAVPAIPRTARAQIYPARPVRLFVGYPAGGPVDIVARLIAQWLSERLGQQFVIENRAGAATNIATEAVVRAPADGYTLLLAGSTNAVNATLYDKLNFNFIRDISPVGSIARTPYVMEVNSSVPAKTVDEFISYAAANPGKVNMATAGPGSAPHVAGELFRTMTNLDIVRVHYRGSAPALADLIAGQVQVMFDPLPSSIGHIRAGRLRPLGVTGPTRSEILPDVPTVGEFVRGYEASGWYGVGAPSSTPSEIIEMLNKEINAGLVDQKMKSRFADLGVVLLGGSPADFAKLIAEETEKWGKVIRTANIKPE
jgi:tripartite-type tricarboxylate transporter receptor subunit TctC